MLSRSRLNSIRQTISEVPVIEIRSSPTEVSTNTVFNFFFNSHKRYVDTLTNCFHCHILVDPVHYTQKGYSLAAAGLESLVYEKKAEEREEECKPNPPKKPRLDLTKNRPAWCMGSVAEAVRSDGPASSSNWVGRGRAAPRGGLSSDRSGGRGRGVYGNGKGRGNNEPYRGRNEAPRGHWVPRGGRPYRGRGRGRPFWTSVADQEHSTSADKIFDLPFYGINCNLCAISNYKLMRVQCCT